MKYKEFMAGLDKGELRHVFLLAGEESYYIDKAKDKLLGKLFASLAEAKEMVTRLDGGIDSGELADQLETAPFFSDYNVILINNLALLKDNRATADKRISHKEERLQAVISDMPDFSYLILVSNAKPDKRRKLYKLIESKGMVLEAEAVRSWSIDDWLQPKLRDMGYTLDRDATQWFHSVVSMMPTISLGYLEQELDKAALYAAGKRITRQELQTVFSQVPEVSGFAMIDAISSHQAGLAMELLRRQLEDGVALPLLTAMLARHVRQLWQARELQRQGSSLKELGRKMDLNPFIAEKLGRAAVGFKPAVLQQAALTLADADFQQKTGQGGPELLEYTVEILCRG